MNTYKERKISIIKPRHWKILNNINSTFTKEEFVEEVLMRTTKTRPTAINWFKYLKETNSIKTLDHPENKNKLFVIA